VFPYTINIAYSISENNTNWIYRLKSEEDVIALVKEVRKEIWEKKYANND
jgi:hypothetical protein